VASGSPGVTVHYCRGCGGPLPRGWKGLFHPNCLKADKRRRVQEAREREHRKFQEWLSKRRCPACGARQGQRSNSNTSLPNFSPSGPGEVVPDTAAAEANNAAKT
jgi:hypothetical protein